MAETMPESMSVKKLLLFLLVCCELLLEGCESVDITESGLLNGGIDLAHCLAGALSLGGYGLSLTS